MIFYGIESLMVAHLLADFPLQTAPLIQLKQDGTVGILLHVFVHMLITTMLIDNLRSTDLVAYFSGSHSFLYRLVQAEKQHQQLNHRFHRRSMLTFLFFSCYLPNEFRSPLDIASKCG